MFVSLAVFTLFRNPSGDVSVLDQEKWLRAKLILIGAKYFWGSDEMDVSALDLRVKSQSSRRFTINQSTNQLINQ